MPSGKWQYSGYGIGFDSKGEFTYPDRGYGKNVIIFGADLSNSRHSNNKTCFSAREGLKKNK